MASSFGSSTTLVLVLAAVVCVLLLAPPFSGAEPLLSGNYEDDKVHEFLRVLDRAAAYRRECFSECVKGCYCSDKPYSCLRECMPTPPTRRCGATYDAVQGVFSSSATFASTMLMEDKDAAAAAAAAACSGDEGFSTCEVV